jgi:hypothetical protein
MLKQHKKAKGPVNRATATRSPSHDSSNKKMRIGLAVGNGIHNNWGGDAGAAGQQERLAEDAPLRGWPQELAQERWSNDAREKSNGIIWDTNKKN